MKRCVSDSSLCFLEGDTLGLLMLGRKANRLQLRENFSRRPAFASPASTKSTSSTTAKAIDPGLTVAQAGFQEFGSLRRDFKRQAVTFRKVAVVRRPLERRNGGTDSSEHTHRTCGHHVEMRMPDVSVPPFRRSKGRLTTRLSETSQLLPLKSRRSDQFLKPACATVSPGSIALPL